MSHIVQTLADTFPCVRACFKTEEALVGRSIVHNRRCLHVHRERRGMIFLSLFIELPGAPVKRRQRLEKTVISSLESFRSH